MSRGNHGLDDIDEFANTLVMDAEDRLPATDDDDSPHRHGDSLANSANGSRLNRRLSGVSSYVTNMVSSPQPHKLHKRRSTVVSILNSTTTTPTHAAGADFFTVHQLYRKPTKQEVDDLTKRPYSANYMYHYPQSLYGPYCERLPEPPQQKGTTMLQSSVGSLRTMSPKSATTGDHGASQPTLADHAFLVSTARPFGREWQELSVMQCKNLSQIGTRLHLMKQLAVEFAHHVAPHAAKIVEERVLSLSVKTIKPLPGFDHVFVHQGIIYTVACTPARVKLYGSREAAHRAASNELKAARTMLGAQYIELAVPLSAQITHMGADVYVTAPVAMTAPGKDALVYGSLSGRSVHAEPSATYEAYLMSEYVPLAKHTVTPNTGTSSNHSGSSGGSLTPSTNSVQPGGQPPASGVGIYTAADVKQFYSIEEGCTYAMDLARWMPPAVCSSEYSRTRTYDHTSLSPNKSMKSRHKIEDQAHAHLSVLFRPEFLRLHCPVQLNGDAGAPGQPNAAQEKIGHAVDHLYGVQIPNLEHELIALQRQRPVLGSELSGIFHGQGVNMRYLGRVLTDLENETSTGGESTLQGKSKDDAAREKAREQLVKVLAVEVTARTWKSLLYDQFALEDIRNLEDSLSKDVLSHLKRLLKVDEPQGGGGGGSKSNVPAHASPSMSMNPSGAFENGEGNNNFGYWESKVLPRMREKFDCSRCPVVTDIPEDATTRRRMQPTDPNSLQLYRAIKNTKVRIEKIEPTEQWEEDPECPGQVRLANRKSTGELGDVHPAASSLLPLLGETAKVNSALIARAFALINIEVSSDVRGKRVVVTFKPKIKPLVPLFLSPAVAACVEHAPKTLFEALSTNRDSLALCQAVEDAARSEISQMKRHSDSDPRSMLPLYFLTRAYIGKGAMHEAFTWMSKGLDLRTNSLPDLILGKSSYVASQLFAQMGRYDRAEALLFDGFAHLKSAQLDTVNLLNATMIFGAAKLLAGSFWAEGRVPPSDKLIRVLDYFYLAAGIMERLKDRRLPYVVEAIAVLRKRLAGVVHCFRCRGPAELVCDKCAKEPGGEKTIGGSALPSERDALSVAHTAGTRGTAPSGARRAGGGNRRNRKEDEKNKQGAGGVKKEQEEDLTEMFVKSQLNPVEALLSGAPATMYGEPTGPAPGENKNKPPATNMEDDSVNPEGGPGLNASGYTDAPTPQHKVEPQFMSLNRSTNPHSNPDVLRAIPDMSEKGAGQYLGGQILEGLATVPQLTRAGRYMCINCHEATGHHNNREEVCMYETAILYNRALKLLQVTGPLTRPAGDAALSYCLVSLGVLQKDPTLVNAAIVDLSAIYGEGSKPVISTQLQLSQVLRQRAETTCKYGGPTQDLEYLGQSEETLRHTLQTLLKKGKDALARTYNTELSQTVRLLQDITETYATLPAAKQEHQARHYLIDILPPHIGETHPLVSMALGRTFQYYLKVANIREDETASPAAITALKTAGNYALQLLESQVEAEDASSSIEYTIGQLKTEVIKALRVVGSAIEHKLALEFANKAKAIISNNPQYSVNAVVTMAVKSMDEVFLRQLKIVEQSAKSEKVVREMEDKAKELRFIVKRIVNHGDRTDHYCQMLVRRALEIRSTALKMVTKGKDLTVTEKARELVLLHDDLMQDDAIPGGGGTSGSGDGGGEGDDKNENLDENGGGKRDPTSRFRGGAGAGGAGGKYPSKEELIELAKPNVDEYSDQALDDAISRATAGIGGGGSYLRGQDRHHGGRGGPYTSPYSVLAGLPTKTGPSNDDGALAQAQARARAQLPRTTSQLKSKGIAGVRRPTSLQTSNLNGTKAPRWLTGPSPTHHGVGEDAGAKKAETAQQLNRIFPRLNQGATKKDYSKLKNIL